MNSFRAFGAALALIALMSVGSASAQEPTENRRVPSLTSDDLPPRTSEVQTTEARPVKEGAQGESGQASGKTEASPEEQAWRQSVKQARQKLDDLKRQSEELELSATNLRNQLSAPGQTPQERNQILRDMDSAGRQSRELGLQATEARHELDKLLEDGKSKGYSEVSDMPARESKSGAPNEEYYSRRFEELNKALETAQRQVSLYENRVRQINSTITNNSRTGDNYFIARQQQELNEATVSLREAQTALAKAQEDLEALKEEGRRNGVPAGVFR